MLSIGGFVTFSSLDWPGVLSAVIFCQGCGWRCRYCHNTQLQTNLNNDIFSWEKIGVFLDKRKNILDGVVFSGGEPLFQQNLALAMQQVIDKGFKVGLHTSGVLPKKLNEIIHLVDWIGLDIKAPLDKYDEITGVKNSGVKAFESLKIVMDSKKDYEVRTTAHQSLLSGQNILDLATLLSSIGVKTYALQSFRAKGCKDEELIDKHRPYIDDELCKNLDKLFPNFIFRG